MQSVSAGNWTRVTVSISYDDNHYTTGTFAKGICPKDNIIARLKFGLVYYESAVHRFNYLHHEYTLDSSADI